MRATSWCRRPVLSYYESRPNIAIAKPGNRSATALELNADWGLHPALRDTIYPLYKGGGAAFILSPVPMICRVVDSKTQDSIEMGQTSMHGISSGLSQIV